MSKANAIKVVEKNPGEKIAYEQSGTKVIFGDDELMVNAARYQKDWPVQVDICADENKNLVIGVGVGRYYVAQMDIPATEYKEVEVEAEETEAATETTSESDSTEENQTAVKKQLVAQPLDMGKVVLTLWSIDDLKSNN